MKDTVVNTGNYFFRAFESDQVGEPHTPALDDLTQHSHAACFQQAGELSVDPELCADREVRHRLVSQQPALDDSSLGVGQLVEQLADGLGDVGGLKRALSGLGWQLAIGLVVAVVIETIGAAGVSERHCRCDVRGGKAEALADDLARHGRG